MGRSRWRRLLVTATVGAAVLGSGVAVADDAAPNPQTSAPSSAPYLAGWVSLAPAYGGPGTSIAVTGVCGVPATSVFLGLVDTPDPAAPAANVVTTTPTGELGEFQASLVVPSGIPPKILYVGALCLDGANKKKVLPFASFVNEGTKLKVADANVVVGTNLVPLATGAAALAPTSGPPGTTIHISGECGYPAGTMGFFFSYAPDGTVASGQYGNGIPVTPGDKLGTFSATAVAPPAPIGVYDLNVWCDLSSDYASAARFWALSFEVTKQPPAWKVFDDAFVGLDVALDRALISTLSTTGTLLQPLGLPVEVPTTSTTSATRPRTTTAPPSPAPAATTTSTAPVCNVLGPPPPGCP